MWHYLFFIILVKVKDPTEFTGPESYVYSMIQVVLCILPLHCLFSLIVISYFCSYVISGWLTTFAFDSVLCVRHGWWHEIVERDSRRMLQMDRVCRLVSEVVWQRALQKGEVFQPGYLHCRGDEDKLQLPVECAELVTVDGLNWCCGSK